MVSEARHGTAMARSRFWRAPPIQTAFPLLFMLFLAAVAATRIAVAVGPFLRSCFIQIWFHLTTRARQVSKPSPLRRWPFNAMWSDFTYFAAGAARTIIYRWWRVVYDTDWLSDSHSSAAPPSNWIWNLLYFCVHSACRSAATALTNSVLLVLSLVRRVRALAPRRVSLCARPCVCIGRRRCRDRRPRSSRTGPCLPIQNRYPSASDTETDTVRAALVAARRHRRSAAGRRATARDRARAGRIRVFLARARAVARFTLKHTTLIGLSLLLPLQWRFSLGRSHVLPVAVASFVPHINRAVALSWPHFTFAGLSFDFAIETTGEAIRAVVRGILRENNPPVPMPDAETRLNAAYARLVTVEGDKFCEFAQTEIKASILAVLKANAAAGVLFKLADLGKDADPTHNSAQLALWQSIQHAIGGEVKASIAATVWRPSTISLTKAVCPAGVCTTPSSTPSLPALRRTRRSTRPTRRLWRRRSACPTSITT